MPELNQTILKSGLGTYDAIWQETDQAYFTAPKMHTVLWLTLTLNL